MSRSVEIGEEVPLWLGGKRINGIRHSKIKTTRWWGRVVERV